MNYTCNTLIALSVVIRSIGTICTFLYSCLAVLIYKSIVFTFVFVFLLCGTETARSQIISEEELCSTIINEAPYTVLGTIASDYFVRPQDGIKSRHRANFRIETGGSWHFCSTGPFYEGYKMDLVIKTLFPVFSCKTAVGAGDIIIKGDFLPEGGADTWAECL